MNLKKLSYADIAQKLLQNKQESSDLFQKILHQKIAASILSEIPEAELKPFLNILSSPSLLKIFSEGEIDDLVYLLSFIDDQKTLLDQLSYEQSRRLIKFMSYPEDTAGRIMQDDFFLLSQNSLAEEGMQKLRDYSKNKFAHYIYCADENQTLLGVLSIRELAVASSQTPISAILNKDVISVTVLESKTKVAELVAKHNFLALPVVDNQHKILGLITVDDVVDVIKEEAVANVYAQAGLPKDDRIYSDPISSVKNRLPWMLLNLFFALLASSIISLFEQTMNRLIILATLKNIVAGIGGNTAIQTLTVTTRGLDTGDFNFTNFYRALFKESIVGFVIGAVIGLGAGVITYFWKQNILVSCVIFIAMLLNSLIASVSGFIIPIVLRKIRKDPAVSSGVLVTIITDIFGFLIFLGVAQMGLKILDQSL